MEWVFLILILVFVFWSAQIVFVYRRQSERIRTQIQQTQTSQEEVSQQAARYEAQVEEKKAELREIESKAVELGKKEKELQDQIVSLKQRDAVRRPTRHKVENPEGSSGEV